MRVLDKLRNIQRDISYATERELEKVTSYSYSISCGDILKLVSLKSNCIVSYCVQFLVNNNAYMIEIPIRTMKDLNVSEISKKLSKSITGGIYENITVY